MGRDGLQFLWYIWKEDCFAFLDNSSRKCEGSCSLLASQLYAQRIPHCHRRAYAEVGRVPARRKGQRIHVFQNAQRYGDFLCVEIPISLCILDIVHGELNAGDHQVLNYVKTLNARRLLLI
ncbi:hypothetical protein CEXT_82421 [Caerostris extrusa]|uniref:Uncharacterized protein n=1 Tax=Caerostris extrusa TaxID=172846 RepID=A0AAV4N4P3_CAEEX|nr:hypothetical protein CEXT_82421 [Caerostris extrusa]